ncbi:MAG: invasion associated locus B family protein [Pseudomonadota bacterium]
MSPRKSRMIFAAAGSTLLLFSFSSVANAANLVKSYRDWSLFSHEEAQKKICFAASQPKESAPASAKRDAVFFYISAWPKDGVKSEISVRMGYPIKPGSTVNVVVGGTKFELFAKDDKAFVANPQDELKLIDAMKRGSLMKVAATSSQGTTTTDNYSLMGISAALSGLATTCR